MNYSMSNQINEKEENDSPFLKVAYDKNNEKENEHWAKKTFQIATIAGVAAGAAALPFTGTVKSTALKTFKTTDEAMARYVKRGRSPQLRLVIDAVRKTPKRMAAYSKQIREQSKYNSTALLPIEKMDSDMIDRTVKERWLEDNKNELVYAARDGRKPGTISEESIRQRLINEHENARTLGMGTSPFREAPKEGQNTQQKGKDSKMNTLTTNALAGVGLGAGITAFHAVDDRVSGGPHKKKDQTYRAGGSWLGGQEKKASLFSNSNKRIDEIGGNMQRAMKNKGAETLQNALIFNGAGLGFAKAIETSRAKARSEAEEKPAGGGSGRIIIDLPSEETRNDVKHMNRNNPMSAAGGGFQQYASTEKTASLAEAGRRFGKNLLGRGEERRALQKNIDGGMDLYKANAPERFGTGLSHTPEGLQAQAAKAKAWDEDNLRQIENEVGGARLKAGLGLAGAGILGSKAKDMYNDRNQQ